MLARVLRFRVGERRWALPLEAVREVLEMPALLKVPRTRPQVAGLVLRHGVLVPVYDLAPAGSRAAQVAVLEWAELLNGLRVSEPEVVQALEENEEAGLAPPCRGRWRFEDGTAERVDLGELYRMLDIPT